MAPAVRAEVALVSLKNCLVNLPPGLIALISNTNIVSAMIKLPSSLRTYPTIAGPECRCRVAIQGADSVCRVCLKRQQCGIPEICICGLDRDA